MQKMLSVTYVVPAPLTWKEFHRLAPRGLYMTEFELTKYNIFLRYEIDTLNKL